jgi:DNA-binding transcriptional LysR family regulator
VVRHGDGNWAGLGAVRLCSEQLFPVCSLKLVSGRNRIARASDLLKFPLLRLDDSKTWSRWVDAAGVTDPVPNGPVLNRASMLIDAAVDGQGVALARTTLAAWDLINGRLVKANRCLIEIAQDVLDRLPEGYVYAPQNHNVPRVATGGGGRRRAPPENSQF